MVANVILRQKARAWASSDQTHMYSQHITQAVVANVILRQKARAWASASNGMFPLAQKNAHPEREGSEVYVRWKDIEHEPDAIEKVKWPMLKRNRVSGAMCFFFFLY